MDIFVILSGAASGAAIGAGWGIMNFFKNKKIKKEKFDSKKLTGTIIVYAVVGLIFSLFGVGKNLELFENVTSILATTEIGTVLVKTIRAHLNLK